MPVFHQVCCNSDHRCCSTANTGNSRFSGCKLQSLTDHTLLRDQNPHMRILVCTPGITLNFRQPMRTVRGVPDCSCCAVRYFSAPRYFRVSASAIVALFAGSGTHQRQDVIFSVIVAASKNSLYGFVFQIFDSRIHISCVDLCFVYITGIIDVSGRKQRCSHKSRFCYFSVNT